MNRLFFLGLLAVSACATPEPERRTNSAVGFLEPGARNRLAVESPDALVSTAEGFERGSDFANARQLFDQVVAVYPDHLAARRGQGRIDMRMGDVPRGLRRLESLYGDYPNDRLVRRDLLDAYISIGQIEQARDILRLQDARSQISLQELVQLGALEEILGDAATARGLWDRVQKAAPNAIEARTFLALSFALDGNYETGIALLQPAIEVVETRQDATLMLANIYALSGQWETALQIAGTAVDDEAVQKRRTLYQLLPKMRRSEQARALLLGQITQSVIDEMTDSKESEPQ